MNTTYTYNRAHDDAHLLARRHERDLQWAKERRRQHERELGEARLLLATKPIALAAKTITVSVLMLLAIAGADWFVQSVRLPAEWMPTIQYGALALVVAVLVGALISLRRVRARRSAASALLATHSARLAHTQYHIGESVHSFIDAKVDVHNTRQVHLV
ncbi:hypothetical protein [Leifsonia poae]|uniref:Uncharacterized protein n=1 Tax=Leifsonia poae TaxID=110933 RepID=A0A9W6H964_9MICO|nr:hypothetical protein [Leifsonia poae]GLJ75880.1 hypothetical protein GCM10017584_14540 [Leifsonia poae]